MTKEEAMKLALDRSEPSILSPGWTLVRDEDIAAMREALAEQPAQQDSTCSNALRAQGKAYPRTCKKCGLGPCVELAQQALDKKAENARELGLDYEPARDSGIVTAGGADPRTQRTWVGLTDEERKLVRNSVGYNQFVTAGEYAEHVQKATEFKLLEKNNG